MKKFLVAFVGMVALLLGCADTTRVVPSAPVNVRELRDETVALVEPDEDGIFDVYCSGFWVKENLILTAHHCVEHIVKQEYEKADKEAPDHLKVEGYTVYYRTYRDYIRDHESPISIRARTAIIVRAEEATDLALLVIEGNTPKHSTATISKLPIPDGSQAFAVGHSVGMYYTFSQGIVSNNRIDGDINILQTWLPCGGGNSGGPIYNIYGEVIGVLVSGHRRAPTMTFGVHRDVIEAFLSL